MCYRGRGARVPSNVVYVVSVVRLSQTGCKGTASFWIVQIILLVWVLFFCLSVRLSLLVGTFFPFLLVRFGLLLGVDYLAFLLVKGRLPVGSELAMMFWQSASESACASVPAGIL